MQQMSVGAEFVEYTINQRTETIMSELYKAEADCLIFSCYIWNIEQVLKLCRDLKLTAPRTKLILAGPEVSYDSTALMERHRFLDGVICGEGERVIAPLMDWLGGITNPGQVPSFVYREGERVIATPLAEPVDMAVLPFPYPDLASLSDRTLYFEATRGCPFSCAYCLSSIEKGVRFMPLEQVKEAMDIFLAEKVRQVKFVDRTFNCNKQYALSIWRYLVQNDNGITNFHFEIAGELLDDETIAFLAGVRQGQFQFEVGVQSTNEETLEQITRKTHIPSLLEICRKLNAPANIHLHLDLIAGLPYEGIASFERSFNEVFAANPQQLQLGFLKVLKGSAIHRDAEELGILYAEKAPYEVLATRWLTYGDLLLLKACEDMVETYYNSGRFANVLELVIPMYKSPYSFFKGLGEFYTGEGWHLLSNTKEQKYSILRRFCTQSFAFTKEMEQRCLTDICLHEKPSKLPDFIDPTRDMPYRAAIRRFYETPENIQRYLPAYTDESPKRVSKLCHIEVFPSSAPGESAAVTALLFDYARRDLTGKAYMQTVPL